jgi:hypothetical protein
MTRAIVAPLILSALLAAGPASARDEPIVNPSDIPISWSKAREPTLEEIGRAIVKGCSVRGWSCGITRPGEIRAVLHVRKHMAESRIDYDTKTFSVTYVDSHELLYDPVKKEIHRKYNGWVNNLIADINTAISAIP